DLLCESSRLIEKCSRIRPQAKTRPSPARWLGSERIGARQGVRGQWPLKLPLGPLTPTFTVGPSPTNRQQPLFPPALRLLENHVGGAPRQHHGWCRRIAGRLFRK